MAIQLLNLIYNEILFHYLRYLHRRCVELGKSGMYGFLDPYYIVSQNDHVSVQTYIQNTWTIIKRICSHHWQLLITNPKEREVTFLCSFGKKPTDKKISAIVDS